MTAKEYLSQGRWLNQKILNRRDELNQLRELAKSIKSTDYEQPAVQSSGKPDAAEKERKKQIRLKSVDNKVKRTKKLILQGGLDSVKGAEKIRLGKLIDKEMITQDDLKAWQAEFEKNQYEKQMNLF